jgi:FAD-dependent urate hydroxylase
MDQPNSEALRALTRQVQQDLALLAYPNRSWVLPPTSSESQEDVFNVVIVGGGQAGLSTALALRREGVERVLIIDSQPEGKEGVWDTFARMTHLRTPKFTIGIEGGIANLSAPAFYKAAYGDEAWARIDRIERPRWMAFLRWFREVTGLQVLNNTSCTSLSKHGNLIALTVDDKTDPEGASSVMPQTRTVLARHVVLTTGFDGCGQWKIPEHIASSVSPARLNHSNEPIDFGALAGKRVGILGHGASAFDNACVVLEHGASSVDLCFRRQQIPTINPHRRLEFSGFLKHFYELDDLTRWRTNRFFEVQDQPPTQNGWDRAHSYKQFRVHAGSPWIKLQDDGRVVHVQTPNAQFEFDHLICATGAVVDFAARGELKTLGPLVKRWHHMFTPPEDLQSTSLGDYPYLGPGFEYQPLDAENDSWVRRVKAFNFSSIVSMGPHTTSASGHKYSVPRLVNGITAALMAEQAAALLPALEAYDEAELRPVIPSTAMELPGLAVAR